MKKKTENVSHLKIMGNSGVPVTESGILDKMCQMLFEHFQELHAVFDTWQEARKALSDKKISEMFFGKMLSLVPNKAQDINKEAEKNAKSAQKQFEEMLKKTAEEQKKAIEKIKEEGRKYPFPYPDPQYPQPWARPYTLPDTNPSPGDIFWCVQGENNYPIATSLPFFDTNKHSLGFGSYIPNPPVI
jgi:hypothetical protein